MASTWKKMAAALALLATAACNRDEANNQVAEGSPAIGTNAASGADQPSTQAGDAATGNQTAAPEGSGSILAWTRPAAGSMVSPPVNELVFHFSPPARLSEVTVTGPEGAKPMMVTAVGEVEHYSLPLDADEPGNYTVAWRATAQRRDYQGSFGFTVR